jgi:hypothetical protein
VATLTLNCSWVVAASLDFIEESLQSTGNSGIAAVAAAATRLSWLWQQDPSSGSRI